MVQPAKCLLWKPENLSLTLSTNTKVRPRRAYIDPAWGGGEDRAHLLASESVRSGLSESHCQKTKMVSNSRAHPVLISGVHTCRDTHMHAYTVYTHEHTHECAHTACTHAHKHTHSSLFSPLGSYFIAPQCSLGIKVFHTRRAYTQTHNCMHTRTNTHSSLFSQPGSHFTAP